MIRKLTEKDRSKVLEYLNQEASYNIFIIGDIENFGFQQDFQQVYGEFDKNNNIQSVLLFYHESSVFYSHLNHFNLDYLNILNKQPFNYLSGKTNLLKLIEPHLHNFVKKDMYFARVSKINFELEEYKNIQVFSTKEDASKLYDLLSSIEEFALYQKEKEQYIKDKMLSKKMGITLYIEEEDKIISTVATTAETSKSAMVVSVGTAKDHRKKSLASSLMKELMKIYLIDKKKELCLFYDNPEAGKIYLRLGFENIGMWTIFKRKS